MSGRLEPSLQGTHAASCTPGRKPCTRKRNIDVLVSRSTPTLCAPLRRARGGALTRTTPHTPGLAHGMLQHALHARFVGVGFDSAAFVFDSARPCLNTRHGFSRDRVGFAPGYPCAADPTCDARSGRPTHGQTSVKKKGPNLWSDAGGTAKHPTTNVGGEENARADDTQDRMMTFVVLVWTL